MFNRIVLTSAIALLLGLNVQAAEFDPDAFDGDANDPMSQRSLIDANEELDFPDAENQDGNEFEDLNEEEDYSILNRDDLPVQQYTQRGSNYSSYPAGNVADTYIRIRTASHHNSGTASNFRWYIGDDYRTLIGAKNPNTTYTWNYSDSTWWQSLHPDQWDNIRLQANSKDGLKIAHIKIVHNGYTILDSDVDAWLDKDYGFQLVFDPEVAMKKWEQLDNTRNPVLYAAVMDLGKSGAWKYAGGNDVAWCSEFASYAIRTGTGLNAPQNSINVQSMKNFFDNMGRLYDKGDVEDGTYELKPGDYVSINDKGHSTIFVEWIDHLNTFKVIDGNWGNRVRIRTVNWSSVHSTNDGIGSIYGSVY
jgi:hypothetical protein